jgi:hypothetical protein
MNLEDQMSVDTAAEASAICVEKHVVLAWTPDSGPDQTNVSITAEKPAAKPEKSELQPAIPPAGPDRTKVHTPEKIPAIQVEQRGAPIAFPVSLPESLYFHCVQPYELDSLTHLVRPVSLAVASLTTGCALGMIPLVRGAIDAVGDVTKITSGAMLWNLIYAMIFALSAGISIIAWINALRGRSDARRLLREIRMRPNIPLSQIVKR